MDRHGKAAAANNLDAGKKCSTSPQKNPVPEIGVAHLLDLPLGVKLPVCPGSTNVFCTTNTSEKKHKERTKISDPFQNTGIKSVFIHSEVVTSKTSVPRQSLPNIPEQATKKTSFLPDADRTKKVICANLTGKKTKKSSNSYESENLPAVQRNELSHDSSHKQQTFYQHHCQEKFQAAKPDTTKVELLKDVQNKKDQLVAPDTTRKESENKVKVRYISDEDKVGLQKVVQEGFPAGLFEGPFGKDAKHIAKTLTSPKPSVSKSTLNSFLSLSECFYPESSTAKSSKAIPSYWTESEETQLERILSDDRMYTSRSATYTDSSLEEKRTPSSVEEMTSTTEPAHFSLHQIMSFSSHNEEDLSLYFSSDDRSDPSAILTEESLTDLDPESRSVKFINLFQCESILKDAHPSSDNISGGSQTLNPELPNNVPK